MEDSAQLQDNGLSSLHGETNGKAPAFGGMPCVPYHGQPRIDSMIIQEATGFLRSSSCEGRLGKSKMAYLQLFFLSRFTTVLGDYLVPDASYTPS
jgi:hypothetical protein